MFGNQSGRPCPSSISSTSCNVASLKAQRTFGPLRYAGSTECFSAFSSFQVKVVAAAVFLVPVTDAASPLGCSGVPAPVPNTRYFASPRPMRVAIRAARNASISTPLSWSSSLDTRMILEDSFLAPSVAPPKDTSSSLVSVFSPSSSPSSVVPSEVAQSMSWPLAVFRICATLAIPP